MIYLYVFIGYGVWHEESILVGEEHNSVFETFITLFQIWTRNKVSEMIYICIPLRVILIPEDSLRNSPINSDKENDIK